jgi:hypothetical protein
MALCEETLHLAVNSNISAELAETELWNISETSRRRDKQPTKKNLKISFKRRSWESKQLLGMHPGISESSWDLGPSSTCLPPHAYSLLCRQVTSPQSRRTVRRMLEHSHATSAQHTLALEKLLCPVRQTGAVKLLKLAHCIFLPIHMGLLPPTPSPHSLEL